MHQMSIGFSKVYIVIEDKFAFGDEVASVQDLIDAFSNIPENFPLRNSAYIIHKEIIDDRYFWLYAQHGTSTPYSQTVLNTASKKQEDNPRTREQIETNKQLFVLCAENQGIAILYISTGAKKFLEECLKHQLKRRVFIKHFFKTAEEFAEIIREINKVKVSFTEDIFNKSKKILDIFAVERDPFGLDKVGTRYTLEVKFDRASVTEKFFDFFFGARNAKIDGEIDALVCVGKDDQNELAIFNSDGFSQKIDILAEKDAQGMYSHEQIKDSLITKIEGKKDA